jgi:glc operon protein GlcG
MSKIRYICPHLLLYSALVVLFQCSVCQALLFQAHYSQPFTPSLVAMVSSSQDTNPSPAPFASAVVITPTGADIGMAAAQAEAAVNGWDVTICICDAGGVPIQVKRNAFPASYDIAVGKAKSAALFAKETGNLEDAVNVLGGKSRASLLSSPFVLMRGGVPLMLDGTCCGAVGVSGVQADQDEQVARVAVEAMRNIFVSKL